MSAAALLHRTLRGTAPIPYARYGAFELKHASRRHLAYGVTLSALFSTLVLITVAVLVARMPPAARPLIEVIHIVDYPVPARPTPPEFDPAALKRPPGSKADPAAGVVMTVPDFPDKTATDTPPDLPPMTLPPDGGAGPGSAGSAGTGPSTAVAPNGVSLTSAAGTWTVHDTEPELLVAPRPFYPEIAKRAMIEGRVRLWLLVGKDGRIARVDVREGVTMLSPAAVEAARGYIFKPALANGRPVAVWVEETFDFRILP